MKYLELLWVPALKSHFWLYQQNATWENIRKQQSHSLKENRKYSAITTHHLWSCASQLLFLSACDWPGLEKLLRVVIFVKVGPHLPLLAQPRPNVCHRAFWQSKKCCGAYDLLKHFIRLEECLGGLQLTSVQLFAGVIKLSNWTASFSHLDRTPLFRLVFLSPLWRETCYSLFKCDSFSFLIFDRSVAKHLWPGFIVYHLQAGTQALLSLRVFWACYLLHSCLLVTYSRFMLGAGSCAR